MNIKDRINTAEQFVVKEARDRAAIIELCAVTHLLLDKIEDLEQQLAQIHIILSDSLHQ